MVLEIIGDWKFIPQFIGNTEMELTLHQLSGGEELKLGVGDARDPVAFIKAIVKKIKNPIELDISGKRRKMKPEDIVNYGSLKDLYFEIILEYHKHTVVEEQDLKN